MQKRLAVLVFLLAIVGNVWAGVCHCLADDDHGRASCCKREKIDDPAFSAQPCCGEECGPPLSSAIRAVQADQLAKISFTLQPAEQFHFQPKVESKGTNAYVPGDRAAARRLYLPRPPELYLVHQSFLI
ncbi:MAG TPA: hypothetical protein VK918_09495 [Pyrinomonadaceae bacterium]|nr:hypothetical protein [Pyrinomonadaceae bacterium]